MFVIRPWRDKDFKVLLSCAKRGKGMTSLPKDPFRIKTLLKLSQASFHSKGTPPSHESYGFIVEDSVTKEAAGVSAIKAVAGLHKTFRFYRLEKETLYPETASITSSELCSLYLLPEYRKGGIGKLLSLSRLHFIASFPERFAETVVAELRGYFDAEEKSPFWMGIGNKLNPMSYRKAAILNASGDKKVESFFKTTPTPLKELPKSAADCIGITHPHTLPAFKMLEAEGFSLSGKMDIVDAGPLIIAKIQELKTVRETKLLPLHPEALPEGVAPVKIISNNRLDFRAVMSQFEIRDGQLSLPLKAARALKVKSGDLVRI